MYKNIRFLISKNILDLNNVNLRFKCVRVRKGRRGRWRVVKDSVGEAVRQRS